MPSTLEAAAVAVRLRRLWLGEVVGSPELPASDLHDSDLDVVLRRVGSTLVVATPFDNGTSDPFAGSRGEYLRARSEKVSGGVVSDVAWTFEPKPKPVRRDKTTDLDVYALGDPLLQSYAAMAGRLRDLIPTATPPAARHAVGALRLVGASAHRFWFAAPSIEAREALRTIPGARAALVTATQAAQRHECLSTE